MARRPIYPGVFDDALASPVTVWAGEERPGIDFTLVPTGMVTVRGRVVSSVPGIPPSEAFISILPRRPVIPGQLPAGFSDAQGTFEIHDVPPGSHHVIAMLRRGSDRYQTRIALEVADEDIEGLVLAIGPGIDLPGRVYVEAPAGGDDRSAEIESVEWSRIRIFLRIETGGGACNARTEPDGSFVLNDCLSGRLQVNIGGLPPDYYLKRIRFGTEEIRNDTIELLGEPEGSLDMLLSASGGRIEGTATDRAGVALAGARVVLIPDPGSGPRRNPYKSAGIDQNGRFALRGIPPGNYRLYAWENVDAFEYYSPEFVRRFETRGRPVRIEDGSRLDLDVRIIADDTTPN